MFLEEWIHGRIRQEARISSEFRQCLTDSDLKDITPEIVKKFQLFKLRRMLEYARRESVFYQEMFGDQGIVPSDVKVPSDLSRLPFTRPDHLAQVPYRLVSVSLTRISRIFTLATSGTSGPPKKVFFTSGDLETITDCMAAIMNTALSCSGLAARGSVIQIFLADGTAMSQRNLVARGAEKMGALAVPGDISAGTEAQIQSVQAARPVMLLGSASRLYRLTQETRQRYNLPRMGVRILFVTSEYLSPSMRKNMEEFWQAEVYHHYGMTEAGLAVAIECQEHNGFHLNEADFLFEVVEPVTGRVLEEGQEGELVLTTLSREGMPLIRYRTGDIARLIPGRCRCGAFTTKIGTIAKRVSLIVGLGEGREEIYPALFDDVLYTFPEVIDYRIFLTREGERDSLVCKVESIDRGKNLEERLAEAILRVPQVGEGVAAGLLTGPRVELVEKGELRREGRAKQRIVDNRTN